MKNFTFYTTVILLMAVINTNGWAQTQSAKPDAGTLTFLGVTQPLTNLEPFPYPALKDFEPNEEMKERNYPYSETALPKGPDPAWQKQMGTTDLSKGLKLNYEGMTNTGFPPDPNGDVGPNNYFQTVNITYQIWDKAGNSLAGPADIRNIWGATKGVSDPVVLYDDNADRWFVEIFTTTAPYDIMMAVSTTSNPAGSYYLYTLSGVTNLPDFTKFSVWRDGYYMAANSGSYDVYAFQRDAMLIGGSASYVRFDNPWRPNSGFHCIMPVDNDGAFAPAGTPGQFITMNDDAWGGSDELWVYELSVNWASPGSATFNRTQQISVASFDSNFGPSWDNIYQQGTAQRLDGVPQVLNFRAQYRDFGSYKSIVCNHTVDVDNTDHAGVRWYQLIKTGTTWSLYQQSTFAPDGHSRWMGAIAQNAYGDICLAYSISSTSMYPSLRFTGRHASDPLNTMTFVEQSIFESANSQTWGNRWGDYYSMSVDPSDNRTFWFTGEYVTNTMHTRIAAINFGVYCAAAGGCDEYISNVQVGSINNSSACTNYGDYTNLSTNLLANASAAITVTNGFGYSGDQCGIWVDWNRDGDFVDANETITVAGQGGGGPYTATIAPPAGISSGLCTMRVRITYTGTVSPCGTTQYGEVEDYSINVISYCDASSYTCDEYISRVQLGTIDNSTACTNYGNYTGISTNFGLTATKTLTVTNGNPIWTSDQCGVWIDWNRDMDFADANETIAVSGSPGVGPYSASITPPAGTTPGPVRMRVRITYAETPNPCGTSSYGEVEDYTIQLNGPNYWTGAFNYYWHNYQNWSSGHIPLDDEDVIMTTNGYYPPSVDFYSEACKTLTINSGAGLFIAGYTLTVGGDINIYGNLTMNNAAGIINVKGNWNNFVGAAGFTEGPGRVVFNGGAYHQYCTNETFNILELNKAAGGAFRPYLGENIVCAAYDWTAGAVDVITGSFTANDLLDNGIFGAYYCNAGGTINLNNLTGNTYVDLNGEMHIYGGTVNVSGGVSEWPYAGNALIEMTDGVLDFNTCGIYLSPSVLYTLTNNITGGTIRTAFGFYGNRADFTPTAGTIELYGASDAGISQSNGCTFWDVNINKSAKNASIGDPILPVSGERIDKTAGNGGKANSVSLYSNIVITDNLTISSGTFEIGGYTCTVANNALVYGTLSMTNPAGVLNVGSSSNFLYFFPGSFGNLTGGNINLPYALIVENGALVSSSTGNTINFGTTLNFGGIGNYDPNTTFGNINVNMNGGKWIVDSYSTAPFAVNGNFSIFPGNTIELFNNSLTIHGILTDNTTSAIYVYDGPVKEGSKSLQEENETQEVKSSGAKGGSMVIDNNFTLNGLMDVGDGNVLLHGIFHLASTGNLTIGTGSFIADGPLFAKNWEYIDGHLGLTSGLFEISHNSINFSASGTSTISGGIVRSGEAFGAVNTGNFQPSGGTVEMTGVGQNTIYCSNGNFFYNLSISRDPTAGSYLQTNIQVNNSLTVNSGTLYMGGYTASVLGGVTINGGNLYVNNYSNLLLAGGTTLNINSGGKISVIGNSVSPGKISRISSGNYALNVQSGGTIAAQYGTFEYMNTSGINLLSGSLVDPVYSFNNCTFQNGQSGGRLLTIENNQLFNVENAVFPTNTWSGSYNVYKSVNAGTVNFVTASGGFAGESFDFDPNNRVNWTGRMLSLKAFMEGPFNGTNMNTTLNGILPLSHPYNVTLPYFGGTPKWYYTGAGSVGAIPNVNIVDWVLLDIRDAATAAAATGATSVARIPAFILSNGNIVTLDGTSSPQISNPIVNNLFVVIYNRNHEGIMNANTIPYTSGTYTYDYSTGASQVYGGTAGHKQLASGIWGMRSGDGNGDGNVTITDKTTVWAIPGQIGKTGYLPSDYNFDRHTNNKDKNDKWLPNNGSGSSVPN